MSRFIPNPAGIAEVAALPGMVVAVGTIAAGIAESAKGHFESQGPHPYDTGEYVASLQSSSGIEDGHAIGHAYSDVPYSVYIEFGTEDTTAFQPLRLAIDSFRL
jgi:hypothetical protein